MLHIHPTLFVQGLSEIWKKNLTIIFLIFCNLGVFTKRACFKPTSQLLITDISLPHLLHGACSSWVAPFICLRSDLWLWWHFVFEILTFRLSHSQSDTRRPCQSEHQLQISSVFSLLFVTQDRSHWCSIFDLMATGQSVVYWHIAVSYSILFHTHASRRELLPHGG